MVGLEGDQRRARRLALDSDHGGVGRGRQRPERLGRADLANRAARSRALVGDLLAPDIERRLRLGHRHHAGAAPPRLRRVLHRGLDNALALPAPRRADRDLDAVVLGRLGRIGGQAVGAGDHDRRHPVGPPDPGGAAEGDEHAVHRLGEVPEGHLLAEHAAEAPRVRQRAEQQERRRSPRRVVQLKPVPLDLLAGRVVDLDRHRAAAMVLADQAQRPQLKAPQLPDQRRVAAIEPGLGELAEQHRRVQVRVIDEPRLDIATERFQAARRRPAVLPDALALHVLRDRLAVAAGMPADRGHGPAARLQRVYLHVVLLCEHPPRVLLVRCGFENRRR